MLSVYMTDPSIFHLPSPPMARGYLNYGLLLSAASNRCIICPLPSAPPVGLGRLRERREKLFHVASATLLHQPRCR